MKFLALLALLPAVLSIPSPAPQPEAYNPFPPTFDTTSTHSNNPISHGNLNSRRHLSALHDQETIIASGKISHKRGMKVRKVKRQAGSGSTCKPVTATATGSSVASSASASASASSAVSSSSKSTAPSTTSKAQGTSAPASSSAKASTTSSAPKPAATNFTVDPDGNGPFKGQATYVGYGSCGVWHKNYEPTVALSRELMDNWPGYNGLNPNNNPICGQRLQLNYGGKSLIAEVQDTCPGCTKRWIDVSEGIFKYFADTSVGMLGVDGYTPGFTWQWVDKNTPLTSLPH